VRHGVDLRRREHRAKWPAPTTWPTRQLAPRAAIIAGVLNGRSARTNRDGTEHSIAAVPASKPSTIRPNLPAARSDVVPITARDLGLHHRVVVGPARATTGPEGPVAWSG
jgi:hypothetical protein